MKISYERSKMRFTKGFLTEAEKAEKANEGRPAWMTDDELWNKLTPERKKEVVDREAKVQQEMETVKNQVEQKAKFTPGSAPTSDNLQDFFNTVDRQGAQARATGEDIGLVANREAGRAIEAQRAEEKRASDKKAQQEAEGRMAASEDLGRRMADALKTTTTSPYAERAGETPKETISNSFSFGEGYKSCKKSKF